MEDPTEQACPHCGKSPSEPVNQKATADSLVDLQRRLPIVHKEQPEEDRLRNKTYSGGKLSGLIAIMKSNLRSPGTKVKASPINRAMGEK